MKLKLLLAVLPFVFFSCSKNATKFAQTALEENMISLEGEETSLENILSKHKGKTIVIDVWASWCGDCLRGLPLVKALQEQTASNDLVYVFLSVDKKIASWKKAIETKNINGEHYFVSSGMKGAFGKAIGLTWIPRYIIVGKDGTIKEYNIIKATDKRLLAAIKADK